MLGFEKEPFSTSPDPEFFYSSREHERALTNVLIELRLKRGLSVVLGDVGTGKTTLSRKLIQDLKNREDCLFHIMLDPIFENNTLFMQSLVRDFSMLPETSGQTLSMTDLRERLERFLFQKGVVENKTVILIIDEAQKLNATSLEALRVLLNYETNQFKLLQLVLLGQIELLSTLRGLPNFLDRISFKTLLNPFDYGEMKEMIYFRIGQAGYHSKMDLFLEEALKEIYHYSKGYPRKVTMLCHRALKEMLMRNKPVVDGRIVSELIQDEVHSGWQMTDRLLQKTSY
ncbi:MAG: transposase [Candidatus Omnitrophica bacterium CG07_land_8_20_14_0_80_50_8]|nr:MAG: transposase [Candidatus Omnitrophica bacterium CG07_land_8_20_14_0_80_50_8]